MTGCHYILRLKQNQSHMKNYLLLMLLCITTIGKSGINIPPISTNSNENTHKTLVIVPDDYSSIQSAIDQSESGDTVVVKPGTYTENINFNGKNVLLTSLFYLDNDVSYISKTIISGPKEAVVKFMHKETQDAIIQGFTIRDGIGTVYTRPNGNITRGGGGILALEASPTIRFNIIEDNEATDISGDNPYAGGGGVRLELGSPIVHNNIIRNNKGGFGGGVFLDATAAVFTNNIIEGNEATKAEFAGGGGLYLDFVLENSEGNFVANNTIVNNLSAGEGGGVVLAGITANEGLKFSNNIIFNNQNEEVFARYNAKLEDFKASYCLIEGGLTSGDHIITDDPKLAQSTFLLDDNSPCIDAGDPGDSFKDPNNGTDAEAPSKGTSRNDIGAYGGPNSFSF